MRVMFLLASTHALERVLSRLSNKPFNYLFDLLSKENKLQNLQKWICHQKNQNPYFFDPCNLIMLLGSTPNQLENVSACTCTNRPAFLLQHLFLCKHMPFLEVQNVLRILLMTNKWHNLWCNVAGFCAVF